MPCVAWSGFRTPSLVTVAEPLISFISPMMFWANAVRGSGSTSTSMKRKILRLFLFKIDSDSDLGFTMALYLPDGV